jgi:hypothetical protein
VQAQSAAHLQAADPLGGVDEQTEGDEQGTKGKLPVGEQDSARHRKLPMASLTFEYAAASIGVDSCAVASGPAPGSQSGGIRRCRATAFHRTSDGGLFSEITKIEQ